MVWDNASTVTISNVSGRVFSDFQVFSEVALKSGSKCLSVRPYVRTNVSASVHSSVCEHSVFLQFPPVTLPNNEVKVPHDIFMSCLERDELIKPDSIYVRPSAFPHFFRFLGETWYLVRGR